MIGKKCGHNEGDCEDGECDDSKSLKCTQGDPLWQRAFGEDGNDLCCKEGETVKRMSDAFFNYNKRRYMCSTIDDKRECDGSKPTKCENNIEYACKINVWAHVMPCIQGCDGDKCKI